MKHRRKKITCWFAVMLVLLMTVTSISAYGQETTQTETNDSGNAGKNVNTVQSSESELQKDTEDSSLKKASNTKVSVNTNYYNKTMYAGTQTYFTFSISSRGYVQPTIWVSKSDAYSWEPSYMFRIVNSSNHDVYYMDGTARTEQRYAVINGKECLKITLGKTRLPAGTYAMQADCYKWFDETVPINFNIAYKNESSLSNVETEFNDTPKTANVISRNKTYQGNGNYKDYDYYKFTVPSARDTTVTLRTKYECAKETGNNIVELLDDKGKVLIENFGTQWNWNDPMIDGNGVKWSIVSATKRLSAGTYYVRIRPEFWCDHYGWGTSQNYESTEDYYLSVTDDSAFTRIAGKDRYATALQVADVLKGKIGSSGKFQNIVVACGENYPDALAGSYLAKKKNAPVLLVSTSASKEDQIASYIRSNISSSGTVYILGGEGVVSKRFYNKVAAFQGSSQVKRLGGVNRYDTNDKILKEAGITSSDKDLIVCTGNGYADSLSASALGKPILLVDRNLTSTQRSYISNGNIKNVYLVGGTGVISNATLNAIQNCNYSTSVTRLSGNTRYGTSAAVAKKFFSGKSGNVVVAYGGNFPDGLAGGPLAMATGNPLLLGCNTNSAMSPVVNFTTSQGTSGGYVLGGASLVNSSILNRMLGR